MVLLGGLELVVGGYIYHRYKQNKGEKRRLEDEVHQRRHHTFPNDKRPHYGQQQLHYQQQTVPQQKYACYAPQAQPQPQPYPQPQYQPRPHPMNTQPCTVPQFHQQTLPLRRSDSFATLSNMPVSNGLQYTQVYPQPPRPQPPTLLTIPFSNAGFSGTGPSFQASQMVSHTNGPNQAFGRNTVDYWETHSPHSPHVHFAEPASPLTGEWYEEDDPPPPYRP